MAPMAPPPHALPAAAAPQGLAAVPAANPAAAAAPAHDGYFVEGSETSQAGTADSAGTANATVTAGAADAAGAENADGDVWHSVVQQLIAAEAITALVRELALQSQLVARDGGHWHLRVERASTNQPTARERLRAALQAAGHAVQISVDVGAVSDSPARRNALAEQERQRVARDIVMNDPFVQALVQNHGAKIVPGSIRPL